MWIDHHFLKKSGVAHLAGKYRKEIELSTQKTKNGELPTLNSALKTATDLRIQTRWLKPKPAISGRLRVFTDAINL